MLLVDKKPYVVIIAEKPKAGKKIAEAFGKYFQLSYRSVKYWKVSFNGEQIVIVTAAGHLYGLHGASGFPVYDMSWEPLWRIDKKAYYTKKYMDVINYVAGNAKFFVNACDYDIEGSVIGYLIIDKLGGIANAKRMKINALTKDEILRAYSDLQPLDLTMVDAGIARHKVDWLWGINVSRALMLSVKKVSGKRVILSAGRVQSPTLLQVVNREMERYLHLPLPEFKVKVKVEVKGRVFDVLLEGRFNVLSEAKELAERLKRDVLFVEGVSVGKTRLVRPPPFNLIDLQLEAGRLFGFSPYKVERLAEELYLDGLISYPRTNSQKIPPTVNVREIVEGISRGPLGYLVSLLNKLTHGKYVVRQGEKDDPAHPAIYPTQYFGSRLPRDQYKLYELIVRRFLASMSVDAWVERQSVALRFKKSGLKLNLSLQGVVEKGWLEIYPYVKVKDEALLEVKEGEEVNVKGISVVTSLSKPPQRFSKTTLLKWMESSNLGTEATRGMIIETLFERKYVKLSGRSIVPTKLGIVIAEVLGQFFGELTDVKMTADMEQKLNDIIYGKTNSEEVANEMREKIAKYVEVFDSNKEKIGEKIAKGLGYLQYQRCKYCDFEAEEGGLCRYHLNAMEKVKEGINEWMIRTGYPRDRVIKSLEKSKYTGKFVLDVVKEMM